MITTTISAIPIAALPALSAQARAGDCCSYPAGGHRALPAAQEPSAQRRALHRGCSSDSAAVSIIAWRAVIDEATHRGVARELVIVGDGPLRTRLERTIHDLDLSDCARITGFLPRTDVIQQLQQATVFALPVHTQLAGLNPEGLGLASLEAAACGLPVIVGDSGGAHEQCRTAIPASQPSGDHRLLADRAQPAAGQSRNGGGDGCPRPPLRVQFAESAQATLREALDL